MSEEINEAENRKSVSDLSIRERFALWRSRDQKKLEESPQKSEESHQKPVESFDKIITNGHGSSHIHELEIRLTNLKKDLYLLGKTPPEDLRGKQALLMNMISEFCKSIRQSCRGNYCDGILAKEINTRLFVYFQESFNKLNESISSLRPEGKSLEELNLSDGVENLTLKGLRSRELYGFVNSQLLMAILIALVETWRPHVMKCRESILESTRRVSATLTASMFGGYSDLCSDISQIITKIIDKKNEGLEMKLEALLSQEQDPFTTQNIFLEQINKNRFASFEKAAAEVFQNADVDALEGDVQNLKDYVKKRIGVWYMANHGSDSNNNFSELIMLIQSYWDVSSRRFVDNICMSIEAELSTQFAREIEAELLLFGVTVDDDKLEKYMIQNSSVAERRISIDHEIRQLETQLLNEEKKSEKEREQFKQFMLNEWNIEGNFRSEQFIANGGVKKYMSRIDHLLRESIKNNNAETNRKSLKLVYEF